MAVFLTDGCILSRHIYMALVKERVLSSLFYSTCHQMSLNSVEINNQHQGPELLDEPEPQTVKGGLPEDPAVIGL